MLSLKINYFNSDPSVFLNESHDLEILLWDLGEITVAKTAGIAQFTLRTNRRRDEVMNQIRNLRLESRVTIANLERDDVF